jgi:hypothetical protein
MTGVVSDLRLQLETITKASKTAGWFDKCHVNFIFLIVLPSVECCVGISIMHMRKTICQCRITTMMKKRRCRRFFWKILCVYTGKAQRLHSFE